MTAQIKVKVVRRAILKLKVLPRLPADLLGAAFITITRDGLEYTVGADYTILDPSPISDPSAAIVAVYDAVSGSWKQMTLAAVVNGTGTGAVQIVTGAGDINVGPNVRVLIMNRAVDESPSKINLPTGAAKVGDIKVVDWKGNSGTFPHDVYPNGSEKFNGALSVWHINGDGSSAVFAPIPTLGYAA